MKNKNKSRSKCCNARVVVRGKINMWYECTKCHCPCSIMAVDRRSWTINPRTRVVPNTKDKELEKLIKNEINNY